MYLVRKKSGRDSCSGRAIVPTLCWQQWSNVLHQKRQTVFSLREVQIGEHICRNGLIVQKDELQMIRTCRGAAIISSCRVSNRASSVHHWPLTTNHRAHEALNNGENRLGTPFDPPIEPSQWPYQQSFRMHLARRRKMKACFFCLNLCRNLWFEIRLLSEQVKWNTCRCRPIGVLGKLVLWLPVIHRNYTKFMFVWKIRIFVPMMQRSGCFCFT